MTTPHKPPFYCYGSDWSHAPWIVSHFPPHTSYNQPMCFSASVLFHKERVDLETISDINGNVTNFFEIIRKHTDEFVTMLSFTPYSRKDAEFCQQNYHIEKCFSKIEAARRFYVMAQMSISGACGNPSGWRTASYRDQVGGRPAVERFGKLNHFYDIAERLTNTQIETKDWKYCVERYDGENVLHYIDPPFLPEVRSSSAKYHTEWTVDNHTESATILRSLRGMVIIAGYKSELYTSLYEAYGWLRVEKEVRTNAGSSRILCLWLCPQTQERLKDMKKQTTYEEMLPIAEAFKKEIEPYCHRVEIAGSIRRKKKLVGDIEIVAIPHLSADMFGFESIMAQTPLDCYLLDNHIITEGLNKTPHKMCRLNYQGHQLDLFLQPDPRTFGVNMMIRTGGKNFSKRMVTPRNKGGDMPSHFKVKDALVYSGGELIDTSTEEKVFECWGIKFIPPEERS